MKKRHCEDNLFFEKACFAKQFQFQGMMLKKSLALRLFIALAMVHYVAFSYR